MGAILFPRRSVSKMRKPTSRRTLPLHCSRTTLAATLVLFLACVVLLPSAAHALDPNKHITQYVHTAWRTQDGSLPAGMFSITQTSDGFLWFLSLPGDVYRYDGVRFLPWQLPDVSHQVVGKVFAGHDGGLWVVANELVHIKNGVIASHYGLKRLGAFQILSEDPDGSVWLALLESDTPLCHVTDSAAKCFGKDDGVPITSIRSILADGKGGFWLGGVKVLVHWHGGVSETYPIKLSKSIGDEVSALALAADGSLWLGISGGDGPGIAQLKDGAVKPFVSSAFDVNMLSVTSMMFDREGNLWVGTDAKGLFRIHGDIAEHYGHTDGLSGDSVWALTEDREGIVWAGSTSGVDSFRDPRVATFSAAQGLGKDLAAGILASRDGTIWVANNGSLDHIKNGTVSSIGRSEGLPGDQVASLLEDHAGNLWVGVDDELYLFKDGRFRRLPEPDHQHLGMVVGMTEDIDGNIWAECASKPSKLVRIRDFQVREVFSPSQVPAGHNLAPDPHGGIWIVRSKELLLFRNSALAKQVPLAPRSSPLNRKIISEEDGSILIGTEDGLVGWRNDKLQRMTTKNGLPCDFVISFVRDKEKRLWLYTRCGVVEFSDSELQRWWANPDVAIQNHFYDAFDGAQPNIGSFNQAATTPDGRVWFASGVVVQMLDPSKLGQNALPATTSIESVTVDRREFSATGDLKLPPNPRDVQIDYTSPTFLIPQKVKFRYRLDNYDSDWHEANTRRQAFYTDLPPGKYSFRVMACNSDGAWNDNAAKLDFSIVPAYYQTDWFRFLCAALFLGLLYAAYQWRVGQLHRQFNMTLDARVIERTRIARELHDTLLQSAHGVLLRFQTVSQLLPERPAEAKAKLDNVIEQTAEFITEARDQVQGLRISTVQSNDLAQAISTLGGELAADSPDHPSAVFRVAVEGTTRNLHPILRDEVYKIAAEALRNAFQHARAQRIEAEIRYDNEQFRLRVRDDGKGIDSAVLSGPGREGHYGLRGMQERAALVGGELTVWSSVDAGTEVELHLPGNTAYLTEKTSWFSRIFARKGKA